MKDCLSEFFEREKVFDSFKLKDLMLNPEKERKKRKNSISEELNSSKESFGSTRNTHKMKILSSQRINTSPSESKKQILESFKSKFKKRLKLPMESKPVSKIDLFQNEYGNFFEVIPSLCQEIKQENTDFENEEGSSDSEKSEEDFHDKELKGLYARFKKLKLASDEIINSISNNHRFKLDFEFLFNKRILASPLSKRRSLFRKNRVSTVEKANPIPRSSSPKPQFTMRVSPKRSIERVEKPIERMQRKSQLVPPRNLPEISIPRTRPMVLTFDYKRRASNERGNSVDNKVRRVSIVESKKEKANMVQIPNSQLRSEKIKHLLNRIRLN